MTMPNRWSSNDFNTFTGSLINGQYLIYWFDSDEFYHFWHTNGKIDHPGDNGPCPKNWTVG